MLYLYFSYCLVIFYQMFCVFWWKQRGPAVPQGEISQESLILSSIKNICCKTLGCWWLTKHKILATCTSPPQLFNCLRDLSSKLLLAGSTALPLFILMISNSQTVNLLKQYFYMPRNPVGVCQSLKRKTIPHLKFWDNRDLLGKSAWFPLLRVPAVLSEDGEEIHRNHVGG